MRVDSGVAQVGFGVLGSDVLGPAAIDGPVSRAVLGLDGAALLDSTVVAGVLDVGPDRGGCSLGHAVVGISVLG